MILQVFLPLPVFPHRSEDTDNWHHFSSTAASSQPLLNFADHSLFLPKYIPFHKKVYFPSSDPLHFQNAPEDTDRKREKKSYLVHHFLSGIFQFLFVSCDETEVPLTIFVSVITVPDLKQRSVKDLIF